MEDYGDYDDAVGGEDEYYQDDDEDVYEGVEEDGAAVEQGMGFADQALVLVSGEPDELELDAAVGDEEDELVEEGDDDVSLGSCSLIHVYDMRR
jgi:hypothetical protein